MLAVDQAGNKLLEFIDVSEERASLDYSPITVCLLVVKIGRSDEELHKNVKGDVKWEKGRALCIRYKRNTTKG